MGNILTKNKSDPGNFEKVLSTLDNDIQKSEIRLSELRIHSRRVSAHWLLFSIVLWIVYSCYYFYNLNDLSTETPILLALPVLLSPLVIFYTRKGISFIYQKSISSQEGKLNSLRKKQKLKLEELKKQTAYYATQSLIDRYDEERSKKRHSEEQKKEEEKQRKMKQQQQQYPDNNKSNSTTTQAQPMNNITQPQQIRWYDKLVDALIGEQGPETKYALICQSCSSHNGLVLPQEINDIEHICPNCGKFNPSRKSRIHKESIPASPTLTPPSSSSSDTNNNEDQNDNVLRKRNMEKKTVSN